MRKEKHGLGRSLPQEDEEQTTTIGSGSSAGAYEDNRGCNGLNEPRSLQCVIPVLD